MDLTQYLIIAGFIFFILVMLTLVFDLDELQDHGVHPFAAIASDALCAGAWPLYLPLVVVLPFIIKWFDEAQVEKQVQQSMADAATREAELKTSPWYNWSKPTDYIDRGNTVEVFPS